RCNWRPDPCGARPGRGACRLARLPAGGDAYAGAGAGRRARLHGRPAEPDCGARRGSYRWRDRAGGAGAGQGGGGAVARRSRACTDGDACAASDRRLHRRRPRRLPANRRDRHAARRGCEMSATSSAPAGDWRLRAPGKEDDETATTTRFWWVRHAPVAHEGRIYGQKDMPCDCTDTAVFTGLARQLPRDAVWVTSHLRRTHETARAIVRAGLGGPDPIPGPDVPAIPDLAEQSFGEWQGLTYEELRHSRG